jgi:peptidoglycan/xylan/chitin deacetylase (PgdA/CDA1 family)
MRIVYFTIFVGVVAAIGVAVLIKDYNSKISPIKFAAIQTITAGKVKEEPEVPTAMPSKRPLSVDELNKMYGPCTKLPVLIYHHVEEEKTAIENNQQYLNITPELFKKQMEYLKNKNYTPISPSELVDFFDDGGSLPLKPVLITLDDAYEDNYINAFPILKEYGFKATIFTPTGLVQNPEYLNWEEIKEMSDTGLIYFGNHTWSHHASKGAPEVLKKEISLADTQLTEKGQNDAKIFAYPYGSPSQGAEKVLIEMGYKLAFTTVHGDMMCKGKRFELPRIRLGNSELTKYGL